jgi:hypothetical protein
VIVVLIHNDFYESYGPSPGVYAKSFLKYRIMDGKIVEVEPEEYVRPWYAFIGDSNIWRFMAIRHQVHFSIFRSLKMGKKVPEKQYQANIDIQKINKENEYLVTEYTLSRMKQLCNEAGAGLIVVMDGDREAIYENKDSRSRRSLVLNKVASDVAESNNITFIDMHPVFMDRYRDMRKFNFSVDFHWNEHGHEVVADALEPVIRRMLDEGSYP